MQRIVIALATIFAALGLVACGGGGSSASGGDSEGESTVPAIAANVVAFHGRELTKAEASEELDRVCGEYQRWEASVMKDSGASKVQDEELAGEKRKECNELAAAMGS